MTTVTPPAVRQEKIVTLVVEDLASHLLINHEQVRVMFVKSAAWTDDALGCPRLGEAYAEQAEPGYLVVLEVNNQIYEYRTDTGKTVILCGSVIEESSPIKDIDQNIDDG